MKAHRRKLIRSIRQRNVDEQRLIGIKRSARCARFWDTNVRRASSAIRKNTQQKGITCFFLGVYTSLLCYYFTTYFSCQQGIVSGIPNITMNYHFFQQHIFYEPRPGVWLALPPYVPGLSRAPTTSACHTVRNPHPFQSETRCYFVRFRN